MTSTRVGFFSLVAALLLAQAPVATKGKMTVAGKTAELSHAYAFTQKAYGREEIVLVLSDVEIPADARRDLKALDELAKAGKIHFVRLMWSGGQTDVFETSWCTTPPRKCQLQPPIVHTFEGKLG